MAEPNSAQQRPPIELRVVADPSQIPVTRSVAAVIAGQVDFDLDDISDVRLAVDEACSHLVTRAVSGATLDCVFAPAAHALRVDVSAITVGAETATPRTFGWHVLTTLTDSLELTQVPAGEGTAVTTISFTKRATADAAQAGQSAPAGRAENEGGSTW